MEAACITSTPYMSALLAIKLSQVLGIHCKISEVSRDATVDSDLGSETLQFFMCAWSTTQTYTMVQDCSNSPWMQGV
jgi:hypothetical protein